MRPPSQGPAALAPRTGDAGGRAWGFRFYAAHLLTVWGLALSNLFLGLTILWSLRHRRRWRRAWRSVEPLLAPLGLYAVLLVAAVASSYDPAVSAGGLKELISLATLGLGVVLVRGEREVRRVFDLLIPTVALLAVYGIVQYFFTGFGDLQHRIVALFSHYQTYAGVLLLGDLLLFARLLAGRFRPGHWAALAAVNWALALTLTRGAWVAAAVTVVVFGLATLRPRRAAGLILVVAAGAVLALHAPPPWRGRVRSIFDPRDDSNYDRLCMIEAGLTMVSEQPLFGLGPRMVRELYPIYRHPTAPRLTVPHLHNAFLDLAAERGLLSLAAYGWLVGASLLLALRAYRREGGLRGERADLHLATMLALVGFNVAGLFENNWGDTEVQRLALFFLAVPCCLEETALPGPVPPLDPEALARLEPLLRLPGRNVTKADVLCYEVDGRRIALKTYAGRPAWIRHGLGRWLVRRETAAYRAAAGVGGLPELVGRVGPYALATAWIEARPLSALRGRRLDSAVFDAAAATLAELHGRGVAMADLHHRDVLVADDGAVFLVDLATAWVLGPRPGRFRRAVFDHLRQHDLAALARMRARWTGGDEAAASAAASASTARWHARGRRAKRWLDRLRGKRRP